MSNKKHNIFINGPINIIRLEGKINGIEKILYTFMDREETVDMQTKCNDIRNSDIMQYLVYNFDKISKGNKIYDFFFEINVSESLNIPDITKKNYIGEINDMFIKSFLVNKEKNTISRSNTFPNIRFHFVDIKDYIINLHYLIKDIKNYVNQIKQQQVQKQKPFLSNYES